MLKIVFTYLYAFAYQYYFKEGDTFVYYKNALQLRNLFFEEPLVYFNLIFKSPVNFNPLFFQYFNFNQFSISNFEETSEFLVSRISSVVMILSGKSYLNVSLVFSILNYILAWNFFSILRNKLNVPSVVLLPLLLWPTLLFWASGINKEIIYMPCLFLIFRFLLLEDYSFKQIVFFLFSFLLLFIMKPFIAVVLFLSLLSSYFINRLKSWYQFVFSLVVLFFIIGILFYAFSDYLNFITLFQLAQKDATFLAGGTGYELNSDISSLSGFLFLILESILVSLYRPYLFEINSFITLFLSMEALLAFLLSVYVIWNFKRINEKLFEYKRVIVFLLFFLIFHSIIFGAISFNYGTLMRFKIVITPLFFSLLFFIIYKLRLPNV